MIDRLSICRAVRMPSRAPVSVCSTSACAAPTVTISRAPAISSRMTMPRVSFGLRTMPWCSVATNPASVALQVVRAREQAAERERAAAVGDGGSRRSGGRVHDDDRGAAQHATGRVFDAASQHGSGSDDLRRRRRWKEEENEHQAGGQTAPAEDGATGSALVVSASDHLKCSISIRSASSRTNRL